MKSYVSLLNILSLGVISLSFNIDQILFKLLLVGELPDGSIVPADTMLIVITLITTAVIALLILPNGFSRKNIQAPLTKLPTRRYTQS